MHGRVSGIHLLELLKTENPARITQVDAYSFDGHRVTFFTNDLIDNELIIGLDCSVENPEEAFTLYPLNDKFPNRVVKQLRKVVVF